MSNKFNNNNGYRYFRQSKKAGNPKMNLWAAFCPAEKVQLLKEDEIDDPQYTNDVHESRWGFHPCDKETYLKLKELHSYYWDAVRQEYEWQRWNNKQTQNRVIRRKIRNELGRVIGREVVGPRPEPVRSDWFYKTYSVSMLSGDREFTTLEYAQIVVDYKKARTPVQDKNKVPRLSLSVQEIDSLLAKIRLDKQAA